MTSHILSVIYTFKFQHFDPYSVVFMSLRGATGTKRRGGPGGLNKLCGITPELQVIVGESALSRTDV